MSNLLELSKVQTSKFSSKFKEWRKQWVSKGEFYDFTICYIYLVRNIIESVSLYSALRAA